MAGELDAVITAVDQLPDDTGHLPDAVLVERMQHLVRVRAMLDAALASQLQAFDARAGARYDGQTSTLAWTRSRLRLGTDAPALLRVARQLDQLPHLCKAFQAGEVTLEHATAVARLIDTVGADQLHDYEPILLDLARQAPPKTLRTACEHLRQLLDPGGDADEAARQRRHRRLTAARTLDHMVHLEGLLDPQSGDIVLAALEAAMPVPAEYEPRTTEQRRADALTDIAAGWLASNDPPTSGGLRPQVTVTVSLRQLQARTGPAETNRADRRELQLGDVPAGTDQRPVSAAQARRLACDASIIPAVLGSDNEILDIGRQSRVVPAGLRRTLNLRDGGCRFAGCYRPASWCDAHHIRHWARGGDTSLDNCLLLCAFHHGLVHEGWHLHGNPDDTIWFQRPDGTHLGLESQPRARPPTRGPLTPDCLQTGSGGGGNHMAATSRNAA